MSAAPRSFHKQFPVCPSQGKHMEAVVKNLADIAGGNVKPARKAFANMLWLAFPSPSEHDLCLKAARVLDVSPRQVKNWLRCQNSAAIHYFFAVAAIAGAEVVFQQIEAVR